jgi:glycosyltransferase involved in cell wall biosynthesis
LVSSSCSADCSPDGESPALRLSVVVPVYGAPESIEPLQGRIRTVCEQLGVVYELIMVDDRCPKGSWQILQRLALADPAVRAVRLYFGQHAAIQAGLVQAKGAWIVVMDCDLQDRPEEIPALLRKAQEGFDVVRARRESRNDSWYRRAASRAFYMALSFLTDTSQSSEIGNFGVYHRKVIDVITRWQEESKYFPAIIEWVGFSQATISVKHDERHAGRSSYDLRKLITLAMNVIVGFSDKPLKLVMASGFLIAILTFIVSVAVLLASLLGEITVEGWTSLVLSVWFLAGCILFSLGLSGLYIGRLLVEAKGRPTFIIDEIVRAAEMQPLAARDFTRVTNSQDG